ncbi:DUF4914 family protein [Rhabdothermincola salaria]|uniref:DUF4914 family protein n=1 Tax=Rhabdothermincola salaria TaxID=2903142 RepID=UPI001E38EC29|nr:DUF4914 family protein [Rhabdothermincola salaria]MCD9623566.1 DUF4914 family protein [Rhabdothermincola salaria]
MDDAWTKLGLPPEAVEVLEAAPRVTVARTADELRAAAVGDGTLEVAYEVPGHGRVVEAVAVGVRNGVSANYTEPYMRRRDPDALVVADELPTDKTRYRDRFDHEFEPVRQESFAWLASQELVVFPFVAGDRETGVGAAVVAPANAGFFALGLALLQGIIDVDALPEGFETRAVIYVVPPFRHTHFDGRQVVVHNRRTEARLHELFAYNLYPGPSAKKGVYGVLINVGEQEGWVVAHCSTVQVVTPYDNTVTFMHEGASGSGKSEMLEYPHRRTDGTLVLGANVLRDDVRTIVLPTQTCELRPVTDDMAMCHPSLQTDDAKLHLRDAEDAWFVRVNHITHYGTDPSLERLTADPPEPLLFLNIDAVVGSRALIWDHTEDAPGVPTPNPRVVLPRHIVPGVVDGTVKVDIRSFGIRTPPCTPEKPTYGIIGLFHSLPPALAWVWRLIAPRGHDNPSIIGGEGMSSEGVGSYWPFATGRRVDQANLLLRQIQATTAVDYVLFPNQHIGCWRVGFMPQWLGREYFARRGSARFEPGKLVPARLPLLGRAPMGITVEGQQIPRWMFHVELQRELHAELYDVGAAQLEDFAKRELAKFRVDELDPLGRQIIEGVLDGGSVEDFDALIPTI